MRLAAAAGIAVPLHGLVYSKDGSMTYFIRRFDRVGKKKDCCGRLCSLMGLSRGHQIRCLHGKSRSGDRPVLHLSGRGKNKAFQVDPGEFSDRQRGHAREELFTDDPGWQGGTHTGL